MPDLKQSTATDRYVFMVDSTDHVTGKTGLTLTIAAGKAGGAFASITPTVTERGNGWYTLSLSTTDTNTLGDLALHVTAGGADPTDKLFNVVANLEADTFGRLGAPAGASHAADVAAVKADTAAISAKTANLPADPADASDIAAQFGTVNSTLATLSGYVDTEVAAILAAVDTEVAAIKAKTDNLPASPAAVSDIPAVAAIRTGLGMASADLDAQLDNILASTSGGSGVLTGVVVSGTVSAIVVAGLPALGDYVPGRMFNTATAEHRRISRESYDAGTGNHTFSFTGVDDDQDRPFGVPPTAGDRVAMAPG